MKVNHQAMVHKEETQPQYGRLKMTGLAIQADKTTWVINDKDVFIIIFNVSFYDNYGQSLKVLQKRTTNTARSLSRNT